MLDALEHAGNPGRGAHEPTLHAARIVYDARETLADTSPCGKSGLHCLCTAERDPGAQHGRLRPRSAPATMLSQRSASTTRCCGRSIACGSRGQKVSFVEVDDTGRLRYEQFEEFLRPNTRSCRGDARFQRHRQSYGPCVCLRFCKKARSYAGRGRGPDCGRTAHRRAGAGGGCSLFHRTQGAAGSAGDRRAVCPPRAKIEKPGYKPVEPPIGKESLYATQFKNLPIGQMEEKFADYGEVQIKQLNDRSNQRHPSSLWM